MHSLFISSKAWNKDGIECQIREPNRYGTSAKYWETFLTEVFQRRNRVTISNAYSQNNI